MKKLLIMLTLGLMFGQTKLETRVYEFEIDLTPYSVHSINLEEITGHNLDDAIIKVLGVDDYSYTFFNYVSMYYKCDENLSGEYPFFRFDNDGYQLFASINYIADSNCRAISQTENNTYNQILKLAITAEFPIEDTGYMEEDFDFCINEGYNLVSYPCENDIAINDAVPFDITTHLESIVGEGVAGVNINGTWVGSLTQLQAGSGYWFKSNIDACFNYDCAEN